VIAWLKGARLYLEIGLAGLLLVVAGMAWRNCSALTDARAEAEVAKRFGVVQLERARIAEESSLKALEASKAAYESSKAIRAEYERREAAIRASYEELEITTSDPEEWRDKWDRLLESLP